MKKFIAFLFILSSAQAQTIGSCPTFPADNIWNTPVDQLPVSPSSSTYVTTIGATTSVHPDFGTVYNGAPNGIPFITVPGSQTKYPVTFDYASESDPGPYAVPLTAPIEGGSQSTGDRHVIAIDTDNCILYELYAAYPQASSWQAGSGVVMNLKSDNLRTATWTSADAAGLPIFPGLIRYDEVLAGAIHHALRFTVPKTQKAYVWPARHYASSLTGTQYPPMGARFRLRASFDVSGFSAANQVILAALKKYGMMIADNGSAWYLSGAPDSRWSDDDLHNLSKIKGSDFEAVDVSSLMVNPNSGQASSQSPSVTVSVAPSSANVQVSTTRQFSATVSNTSNPAVNWSVNGVIGGNPVVGTISLTGLYTAPTAVPSSSTATIEAASQVTPSAFATASVTITPAPAPPPVTVGVAPSSASVQVSTTRQFGATVTNTSNSAVTWSVNGVVGGNLVVGSISLTGLYTAPAVVPSPSTVTVKAASQATPTAFGTASVTITPAPAPPPPPVVSVTITPTSVTLRTGQSRQFTASVQGSTNKSVSWKVNGIAGGNATVGTINTQGAYRAPTKVPSPNVVTVSAVAAANGKTAASAAVTIVSSPNTHH